MSDIQGGLSQICKQSTLVHHKKDTHSLSWNSAGTKLVSSSAARSVVMWDAESNYVRKRIITTNHKFGVQCAKFVEGDGQIVTCGFEGFVNVLSTTKGPVSTLNLAESMRYEMGTQLVMDPVNSHRGIVATAVGKIVQFDIREKCTSVNFDIGKDVRMKHLRLSARVSAEYGCCYSGNGMAFNPLNPNTLAVGTGIGAILLFDSRKASSPLTRILPVRGEYCKILNTVVAGVAWDQNNRIIANMRDDEIYEIDTNNLSMDDISLFRVSRVYTGRRDRCREAKDVALLGPQHIVSGGDDGKLYVWDRDHPNPIACHASDAYNLNCVAVHAGKIATAGVGHAINIWGPSVHTMSEDEEFAFGDDSDSSYDSYNGNIPHDFAAVLGDKRRPFADDYFHDCDCHVDCAELLADARAALEDAVVTSVDEGIDAALYEFREVLDTLLRSYGIPLFAKQRAQLEYLAFLGMAAASAECPSEALGYIGQAIGAKPLDQSARLLQIKLSVAMGMKEMAEMGVHLYRALWPGDDKLGILLDKMQFPVHAWSE